MGPPSETKSCFVIMPIATPADVVASYGGDKDHFRHVLDHLFIPAIEGAGFTPIKPAVSGSDVIQAEIIRNLEQAELVLCDISGLNANAFFELGIRTALDKPVCMLRDDRTPQLPFDTSVINCPIYRASLEPWHINDDVRAIQNHLEASSQAGQERNALWRYFGLTQRGAPAPEASSDSASELLRVVLEEVRGVRRGQGVEATYRQREAGPASVPLEADVTNIDRVKEFLATVQAIAGEVSAKLSVTELSADRIVLDLGIFTLDRERRDRIVETGARYGFDVSVTG